jgi:thioredoxin reductase
MFVNTPAIPHTLSMNPETFDVLVVGGGAAGLAGALALGRSRRSVLVVDAGEPRNAPADAVHNYLGREGTSPAELSRIGRSEVEAYGVQVRDGRVVGATPVERDGGPGFEVTLADGSSVVARRLLVTTGATDRLPDVPGLAQRWGRDVLHCPYCHGFEVRDRAVGVLAVHAMAAHSALLFAQLTDDVVVFLDGKQPFSDDDVTRLTARGIRLVPEKVTGVLVQDDRLTGITLEGGEVVARDALVVASSVEARSELLETLGVATAPVEMNGVVFGTAAVADPTGRTDVPGVWVAGNVSAPMSQVIASAAAGLMAGAMINMDLVEEETVAAVARMQEAS